MPDPLVRGSAAEPQISGIPISKFGTHDALTAEIERLRAKLLTYETRPLAAERDRYRALLMRCHSELHILSGYAQIDNELMKAIREALNDD